MEEAKLLKQGGGVQHWQVGHLGRSPASRGGNVRRCARQLHAASPSTPPPPQVVFGTGELGLEFYMSSSGRPPAVSNVRGQAKSIGVKIKDSLVRIGENDIEPTITQVGQL